MNDPGRLAARRSVLKGRTGTLSLVTAVAAAIVIVTATSISLPDLSVATATLLVTGDVLLILALLGFSFAPAHTVVTTALGSEQIQQQITDVLDDSIALVDQRTGAFLDANRRFLSSLGYARDELPQLKIGDVYLDITYPLALDDEILRIGTDCRVRTKDGQSIELQVRLAAIDTTNGPVACIVGRDISERRRIEESLRDNQTKLAHLAANDALTGLPNRTYLQTHLEHLLAHAGRQDQSLAFFCIDLDYFKNINDSLGHDAGDEVLKLIARRLRADIRADDVVIRTGGDEFVIVTSHANGTPAARAMAERILGSVRVPIALDATTLSLAASIGIARYPEHGLDGIALLKNAEIALYQAKELGRNTFECFSSDMDIKLSEQIALEQALRRAIGTDQIYVEYQPIIDLTTGKLAAFEALARWRDPQSGLISPVRFIPIAEKSGLILPLGEQILHAVIVQMHQWQELGLQLVPVSVNVAPLQLERTAFSTYVHELLMQYDLDPCLLAFEVTESAWMQDSHKHIVIIDTLRSAGSRIYVDDFGTGFSNLSYLKALPVDTLKIDQSFTRTIDTDPSDAAIVSGIIAMADKLKLDTVAEGIETAAHARMLRELGCKYGQGYYFSRPLAAERCRSLLEQIGTSRDFTETLKLRALGGAA
jgi:diguanylate cyclase (GGDEF)-like protein/PAS domain S-box-containing protein